MPIVYRMRGLLGDATEDMVNSLDTSTGNARAFIILALISIKFINKFRRFTYGYMSLLDSIS